MRKAFTLSAIAVAATVAMAAPATAFASETGASSTPVAAAGTPSATDTPSAHASSPAPGTPTAAPSASDKAEAPVVSVTSSPKDKTGYAAGEVVRFKVTAPTGAKVSAKSDALDRISLTPSAGTGDHRTYAGTGTVKSGFGIGTAHLTVTADYGDTGAQSSATFLVDTETRPSPTPPVPVPAHPSMTLSTDGGKPGDKVAVTIESGNLKGNATVKSRAFTGPVNLERDPQHEGTWHGRATVSGNTRSGYYAVDGYVGTTKIDTAKFGVAAGSAAATGNGRHTNEDSGRHTAAHTRSDQVKPVQPHQYKVPKGSVQTGMAPAASASGDNTGLVAGTALGATALVGAFALRRRHGNG
ncbi:hypothetical protein [Streptomyces candidus]|uniref:Gram-positive cocci surface proteins LPxTG domain-containing protein n=1 Tax=Streptomyces candidus TaxID=67283 RepID=A0A7X0LRJ2_9ACTN|nr:hypothetical protein [Streptomyces candidus]MBB6438703.1 hypothetical protein [Streptomyces candidus]GHH44980.1 hypothetical protein GCM10018773_33490 [Streptomyces candidus]